MNKEIVDKIKRLRIAKVYNHSEMADKLNITRSAYQRLETGETYSWAKYLDELMAILDTTPNDFFSDISKKTISHQTNKSGGIGYIAETLIQDNKDVYDKLIASKDEQIALLKSLLEQK